MADQEPTIEFPPKYEPVQRAIHDALFYANVLCRDKPERYEVRITTGNEEAKLSDTVRLLVAEIERLQSRCDTLEGLARLVSEALKAQEPRDG